MRHFARLPNNLSLHSPLMCASSPDNIRRIRERHPITSTAGSGGSSFQDLRTRCSFHQAPPSSLPSNSFALSVLLHGVLRSPIFPTRTTFQPPYHARSVGPRTRRGWRCETAVHLWVRTITATSHSSLAAESAIATPPRPTSTSSSSMLSAASGSSVKFLKSIPTPPPPLTGPSPLSVSLAPSLASVTAKISL